MPGKGVRRLKGLLPRGAVWETKDLRCLKCRQPFESKGYRIVKSGVWIGKHLCMPCVKLNRNIRGSEVVPCGDERVREV